MEYLTLLGDRVSAHEDFTDRKKFPFGVSAVAFGISSIYQSKTSSTSLDDFPQIRDNTNGVGIQATSVKFLVGSVAQGDYYTFLSTVIQLFNNITGLIRFIDGKLYSWVANDVVYFEGCAVDPWNSNINGIFNAIENDFGFDPYNQFRQSFRTYDIAGTSRNPYTLYGGGSLWHSETNTWTFTDTPYRHEDAVAYDVFGYLESGGNPYTLLDDHVANPFDGVWTGDAPYYYVRHVNPFPTKLGPACVFNFSFTFSSLSLNMERLNEARQLPWLDSTQYTGGTPFVLGEDAARTLIEDTAQGSFEYLIGTCLKPIVTGGWYVNRGQLGSPDWRLYQENVNHGILGSPDWRSHPSYTKDISGWVRRG